ncbi:MAG: type II secretion system protein [Candidatus Daviesbacteria bacterium]|nr:type II secretion system protein [Candidatus Daviesbacteria bacterium]
MKKLLPKTKYSPQGFTLVELLVVVSIIAVLSIIGITIFTGVQKNARDARRRGDIDSMSKAIEAHMNNTTNQYCTAAAGTYCAPQDSTSWFSSGTRPIDPATSAQYTGQPVNGATSYTVCATLESGGTFCRSNQQ